MGPAVVTTPKTLEFKDTDKRTLDDIASFITQEMRTHKRWTPSCTAIMQKNPRTLFLFDRFEHSINVAYGRDVDYKIALNPCMIQCYHPHCLRRKRNPVKLRNMFILNEYLYHLEDHVDDIGCSMQERFGAVHKNLFVDPDFLNNLAPPPSSMNDTAQTLSGEALQHLYSTIDAYGIERIMVQYRGGDVGNFNAGCEILPINPHYLSHWSDVLISNEIIRPSSLQYQESDAFIFSVLNYPDPIRSWSVWGTIELYATKMYSSVGGAALNLFRGITDNRITRRNCPLVDIHEFVLDINHPCPSVSCCQSNLPNLKYENRTMHSSEVIFHISCLEASEDSFKFVFSDKVVRYPVVAVVDEQEINQGTFVVNGELCGLRQKMTAADIRKIGLENLAKYIAEKNNFVVAVRENVLVDLRGICCSNPVTTFECGSMSSVDCLQRLNEMTTFSNSCLDCLCSGWPCTLSKLDEMCSNCVDTDTKCVSLAVIHSLMDMGSSHKKAEKNNTNRLTVTSSDEEMMDAEKYNIAFGGLHLAKAIVNSMRNHILQYNGEFFGTNVLLSIRHDQEILQNIKNAVFVGKDRQSDLLAYMTVCPLVQEALRLKGHSWVQRIPERHLSYKSNAKSQKKIILCVDVCANRNGDLYLLDAGAACVHVIDHSNVASVRIIGKYNTPNMDDYHSDAPNKNILSKIRLSNRLLDISIDSDDNLYLADGMRCEVIVIRKCYRAKSCKKKTARFYVFNVPEILSCSVISNKLFVLQRSNSETVVKLLNYRLPKTNLNKYHLKYTVAMTLPCNAERLFSVPFHKCFGGQDGNELKLFYYSKSKKVIKLEKQLEVKSLTKPSLSDNGMVIVGTESGVAVHQMYGEGLMKIVRHDGVDGFVKCVFIRGNVVTAAVLDLKVAQLLFFYLG